MGINDDLIETPPELSPGEEFKSEPSAVVAGTSSIKDESGGVVINKSNSKSIDIPSSTISSNTINDSSLELNVSSQSSIDKLVSIETTTELINSNDETKNNHIKNDENSINNDTISILKNDETGACIHLIGTAHFSTKSQDDVSRVLQVVQPNLLCVELCKSRAPILSMDEKQIEFEAQNITFDKIKNIIEKNGLIQGIMYVLFLNMSSQLTKKLGMAPGGEFRRALNEVKKFPTPCLIHFGDRPIHITIQRALSCLSWWQTIKLFTSLCFRDVNISEEDVEKCKQKDILEQMLEEMSDEYPELGKVFVHERDLFLTWTLQNISYLKTFNNVVVTDQQNQFIDPNIPCEPVRAVAIVGIGHVPGITKLWGTVTHEDIEPILYVPPPSRSGKVVKFVLKVSFYSVIIWGITKICPNLTKQTVNTVKLIPKIFIK